MARCSAVILFCTRYSLALTHFTLTYSIAITVNLLTNDLLFDRQEEERRRREEEMMRQREIEEQMRRKREESYRMGGFMDNVSPAQ